MTLKSVRETSVPEDYQIHLSAPTDTISIDFTDPKPPQELDLPVEYPFGEYNIYKGEYKYKSSTPFGSSEASGKIELRTGSGLLIIERDGDKPRPEKIFDSLKEVINSGVEIYDRLIVKEDGLWNFIEQAADRNQVKVLTPSGEVKLTNEINGKSWEEIKGNYPLEFATTVFEYNDIRFNVTYSSDYNLRIETSSETAREYIIQLFEATVFREE